MLATAAELHARGGGGWPALALIAADTANEAILGTIASKGKRRPGKDANFEEVFNLAETTFGQLGHRMRDPLARSVLALHRRRNAAVHYGVEPVPRSVSAALSVAAELRSLAVDTLELLEAFRDAGPTTIVAKLVDIEPITSGLIAAEAHLRADALKDCADECAIAFDVAVERVKPGLRSYRGLPPAPRPNRSLERSLQHELAESNRRLGMMLSLHAEQTRLHEHWILAGGLGVAPIDLQRLQRILGDPVQENGESRPRTVTRSNRVIITRPKVEWALQITTDVVFRLWLGESLAKSPWPHRGDPDEDFDEG